MTGFETLRLDGVTRRFAGADALTGLDLEIRRGEFIALLGPSGCGKSTALNCLAGLLPLSAGSIWRDGTRLDTLPAERRGFGMVFQNYALFPHLSVQKNVSFGLRMRGVPRAELRRRTQAAIRLVHLEEHATKLPGQLSGGQQQRVAIARAVVIEPSLVLMDEPLSNLDAKLRLEMRTEIRKLHQDLGLTTVYVTHDQEEALSMADRLVVLRSGRVQQIGTPEEVHTRPANRHVADFLGFRNLLPGFFEKDTINIKGLGVRTAGSPVRTIRDGAPAVAAIRPEDITLGGGVEVTVEVAEYHGREIAAEARTADGLTLHLRTPQRLAPGDKVAVTFPPEKLLIFPADDLPSEEAA
ncbi:ABC transporter ATP-binding protein [Actinoplanes ianthinogenes]|uniref:ABC transporter ATP-binding protein n=1 Tax=Actinoplanes ianthinogenes TaxID=122358 RepID=A0ABN6C319_9ACTN|nr:ABC transporter ATP-binding protein [Actinoplanes ianthinogenes]BCJ39839.1 ABC transporter ATP-binding protein [Actinoplanes ianthinogenes]GGR08502.1 ABC transporter ATP-binding protein [Actinoplanes ianthinogenes]